MHLDRTNGFKWLPNHPAASAYETLVLINAIVLINTVVSGNDVNRLRLGMELRTFSICNRHTTAKEITYYNTMAHKRYILLCLNTGRRPAVAILWLSPSLGKRSLVPSLARPSNIWRWSLVVTLVYGSLQNVLMIKHETLYSQVDGGNAHTSSSIRYPFWHCEDTQSTIIALFPSKSLYRSTPQRKNLW